MRLQHDNIVRTIKCGSRPIFAATSNSTDGQPEESKDRQKKLKELGYSENGKDLCGQILETWIVMEFCDIGNLSDAIANGFFQKRPALQKFLEWQTAMDIASAMEYLHSQDIVHGDLKGANVLLRSCPSEHRSFIAKVSDFGLSKFMSPMKTHHSTRSHGTITHMPPEMLRTGTLTKAVDVYSFGVILWEIITARSPFKGLNHY